jgi:hypothetical protein
MKPRACVRPVLDLVLLTALVLSTVHSNAEDKKGFSVVRQQLYRNDQRFVLHGMMVPYLAECPGKEEETIPATNRVADVGGNAVVFDLTGFTPDFRGLDPGKSKALNTLADTLNDTRMALVLRIALPGDTKPQQVENAAKALARSFSGNTRLIFWCEGPAAATLAKTLKENLPQVVVMSVKGPDLYTFTEEKNNPLGANQVLIGKIPQQHPLKSNFILSGHDLDYFALDGALKRPEEQQAYTPDLTLVSAEERAEGFFPLFNGKDLNNWWVLGENRQGFRVTRDGAIEWAAKGANALMSHQRFSDFVLRLEYKIEKDGNSGVYCRAPRDGRQSRIGFEVQLRGDYGGRPDAQSTGAIYDVVAPRSVASKKPGEWNTLEIRCEGPRVQVWINGKQVQDVNFEQHPKLRYRLRKGFIGLQDHNRYVAFRNIRIKPL